MVNRVSDRCLTTAVLLMLCTACAARNPSAPAVTDGYDMLPVEGKRFGRARTPESYKTLTEAQRVTFESIVHALKAKQLLDIVDAVTAIWGESYQEDDPTLDSLNRRDLYS